MLRKVAKPCAVAICREGARETDEKHCSSERACPDGIRRLGGKRVSSQLPELPNLTESDLSKKVVIVDAPKEITSSSAEENFGFWIDEPTKVVTFADGKKLTVRRFDDSWISAVSGDVSYELDRQNGNLTYAGSTIKGGIATTVIGTGRCTAATAPAR